MKSMESQLPFNEGFALHLATKTAICLGRLCRAEMGTRCGLTGVDLEIDSDDPTAMEVQRVCSLPEDECPGSALIGEAANIAIAQINAERN